MNGCYSASQSVFPAGCLEFVLFRLLVNTNVINLQALWPDRVVNTLSAAPVTTDSQVKQQVKRLVERPLLVIGGGIRKSLVAELEILPIIDVPADFLAPAWKND